MYRIDVVPDPRFDGYMDFHMAHLPNSVESQKVYNGKLELEIGKTGNLSFDIFPSNSCYNRIEKLVSQIVVYDTDNGSGGETHATYLFVGRVLNDELNWDGSKHIEAEGILSYLLDTPDMDSEQYIVDGNSPTDAMKNALDIIIKQGNIFQDPFKQFEVGEVNVPSIVGESESNQVVLRSYDGNSLNTIKKNLINTSGGYLHCTYYYNPSTRRIQPVINYLKDYTGTCNQTIDFGSNLLDFKKYVKGEDIFTEIIPFGNVNKSTGERITLSSPVEIMPDGLVAEDIYKLGNKLYSIDGYNKFGIISKVKKYDVDFGRALLADSFRDLYNMSRDQLLIEISAIDLHTINPAIDSIQIGNKVHCRSQPHNFEADLICRKISIDFDDVSKTRYEFSYIPGEQVSEFGKALITKKQVINAEKINENEKSISDLKQWVTKNFAPKQ